MLDFPSRWAISADRRVSKLAAFFELHTARYRRQGRTTVELSALKRAWLKGP